MILDGDSQKAVTIGTRKYTAQNIDVTLLGIRAPGYLNTVLEVPLSHSFSGG